MTLQELKDRQSWTLEQKIDHSVGAIEDFIAKLDGKVYVSFSGGKDSTVLLDICRMVCPDIKAVFCNTRNEYPEIFRFVKHLQSLDGYNIEIIRPEDTPQEVLEYYGFPLVSKSIANIVGEVRRNPDGKVYQNYVENKVSNFYRLSEKWEFLLEETFDTSAKCCYFLKKKPFNTYQKKTGLSPITGEMASESMQRALMYIRVGSCNLYGSKRNVSRPLSIWTEEDVLNYIKMKNLPIAEIYNRGAKRTGCMFCGFGCQFADDNRLQLCYELYPKMYDMFMSYQNNGVTYREALKKVLAVNKLKLPDEKVK